MELTPVEDCGLWWVKREDLACYEGDDAPSGAKVRQYVAMARKHPKGTPMIVGCSAFSAQQIYVADAAARMGAPGYIFVPARAKTTPATQWCIDRGATVLQIRPGYPSVYRAAAKLKAKQLGGCIRWDINLAVTDTAYQTQNLPDCCRVVVPTGSGLTAAGVLVGLAQAGRMGVEVVCAAVSDMANTKKITEVARKFTDKPLPEIRYWRSPYKYEQPKRNQTAGSAKLDPYYAAKALPVLEPGDVLWVSGARPLGL